jgi:hypothetical protein
MRHREKLWRRDWTAGSTALPITARVSERAVGGRSYVRHPTRQVDGVPCPYEAAPWGFGCCKAGPRPWLRSVGVVYSNRVRGQVTDWMCLTITCGSIYMIRRRPYCCC